MRPEGRQLARVSLGAYLAPQCRCVMAASIPPLLEVGGIRCEQRWTRSPRLAFGEALSMEKAPHRTASQLQTASDLPQTHALVMQRSYGFGARLTLGATVTLLALQPRQTFA